MNSGALVFCCALGVLAGCALSGCVVEPLEPDVGPLRAGLCEPQDSDPDRDVSYMQDIAPLFERPFGKAGCSCHQPMSRVTSGISVSGLNLGSYAALMRGGNASRDTIVVPGDPCMSLLVQKVSNAPPTGNRMPSDGPPYLSPSEQQLLTDWIVEGAHDN
jgi:hypothetical protein